ncbi:MAG: hypothetical protein KBT36_15750 [Kurthia sp.]|nr:hypothetical protein [Candidatus Kurthia equi]
MKKGATFKNKISLKYQLIQTNIIYLLCVISLLDLCFGASGWGTTQVPMAAIEGEIYAPSATSIFCALGLIILALKQGQPHKQAELKPYISTRKSVVKLDFCMLAIYSFYFTLLSLFLPYINIFLHLIFQKEPFIHGYTIFSNPIISLVNTLGIFLVFYVCSLSFYFISICWAKNKINLILAVLLVIILLNLIPISTYIINGLAEIPWDTPFGFLGLMGLVLLLIGCMSYFVQRKMEV